MAENRYFGVTSNLRPRPTTNLIFLKTPLFDEQMITLGEYEFSFKSFYPNGNQKRDKLHRKSIKMSTQTRLDAFGARSVLFDSDNLSGFAVEAGYNTII